MIFTKIIIITFISRIRFKILGIIKLFFIDENRDNRFLIIVVGFVNQRTMAIMKRSHCGNITRSVTLLFIGLKVKMEVRNIFDYQHIGIFFIDFISIIVKCMNTFLKANNNEKNIPT